MSRESGEISITIIGLIIAIILMFMLPLGQLANNSDDTAKVLTQQEVSELVKKATTTGELTQDDYNNLVSTLAATGNTYDIEIEVAKLDENVGKKTEQQNASVIGENVYITSYTTSNLEDLHDYDKKINLKEGDIITVRVKNNNTTFSQMLNYFMYKVTGNDIYIIVASDVGTVQ